MITFQPLTREDSSAARALAGRPLVARWWNHETSPEAVERDFGPSIDGADVTELFLVAFAGRPIGLVQRYPIAAYPEYVDEFASISLGRSTGVDVELLKPVRPSRLYDQIAALLGGAATAGPAPPSGRSPGGGVTRSGRVLIAEDTEINQFAATQLRPCARSASPAHGNPPRRQAAAPPWRGANLGHPGG